jgi:hypothetical protein
VRFCRRDWYRGAYTHCEERSAQFVKVLGAESPPDSIYSVLTLITWLAYTPHRGQHVSRLERYFSTLFIIFDLAPVPPFGCLRETFTQRRTSWVYTPTYWITIPLSVRTACEPGRQNGPGNKNVKFTSFEWPTSGVKIPLDPNRYEKRKCSGQPSLRLFTRIR